MPRAFTEEERLRIRDSLIVAGRKCFLKYGMKKTTVDDLVRLAGVARGSFYQFFNSKEALYLEIFLQEIPAMMARIHDSSFGSTTVTRDALVLMMKAIMHEINTNDLARVILDDPAEITGFLSTLDHSTLMQEVAKAYAPMIGSIRAAQMRGEIIEGDPSQIAYCLGMVKSLAVYRENIPDSLYEFMTQLLPQVIADGLTCPAGGAD
jgi:AcrR family transcriptional regulator